MKRDMTFGRMAYVVALAGVAGMMVAGCAKESGRGLTLVAENHQGGTKTSVSGTSINWVDGDEVNINDVAYTISYSSGSNANVEVTAEENATLLACYPASVQKEMTESSLKVDLPAAYTYAEENGQQSIAFPMAAKGTMEESGKLYFKHLCAGIEVKVKNTTGYPLVVRSISVESAESQLCGQRDIDISSISSDFAVAPSTTSTAADRRVSLALNESDAVLAVGAEKSFQIPVYPIKASDKLTFTIYAGEKKIKGVLVTAFYTYSKDNVDVATEIGRAKVSSTPTIEISIGNSNVSNVDSKFTVGSGQQVYFSQGILQFSKQSGNWSFATSQYKGLGEQNLGSTDMIDLFCYGETNPNSSYSNVVGDVSNTDKDWARAAGISFDGGTPEAQNEWRTLTWGQWKHLLYERTTNLTINGVANASYVLASINGDNGVVLFPDNFYTVKDGLVLSQSIDNWNANAVNTKNYRVLKSDNTTFTDDEENNVDEKDKKTKVRDGVGFVQISNADWAILEAAGCVFMVADGWISSSDPNKITDEKSGYYWLGTQFSNNKGYDAYLNGSGIPTDNSDSRPNGSTIWAKMKNNKMSVRMVRDVE